MVNFKIFSFFSGSGFLDLGFENNGFKVEFINEFHPAFMNAYKYSREKMKLRKPTYGYFNCDINEFLENRNEELKDWIADARKDGSLVGFIGGPPCPDFSVAGKNRGREGDNGKLSLSYTKLIIEMKPDFFLFENVKGLWKTARHRAFFEELKANIQEAGFHTTNRLTNALEYGAPQDRDRILLFGIQSHLIQNSDLSNFPWDKYRKYDLEYIKSLPWPDVECFIENSETICPEGIPIEMTVQYWFEKNDVVNHPNGNDFFIPRGGLPRMQNIKEGDVSKKIL